MKKGLLILFLIVFTATCLQAQNKMSSVSNGTQTSILRFYPNPATTVISFDFQKPYDKGYSLQVYNVLGRKMLEQNNISDHSSINLTDFIRGVYVYQLIDKTGKLVETGKFQVSK